MPIPVNSIYLLTFQLYFANCYWCTDRTPDSTSYHRSTYRVQTLSLGIPSAKRSCTVLRHWHTATCHNLTGKCVCPRLSVCLSVSKIILKNAWMDLDEILRVDRCRDMGELINLEARSGLLSPLSYNPFYAYAEFYVGKIRRILIGRCSEAWF